jgi:serine/threonine protein phosphatase PrpC
MSILVLENTKTVTIESAALSDPGIKRELNQDAIFHQSSQLPTTKPVGLFIVCDGMGGHRGGEIASRIAVDTITAELADLFVEPQPMLADEETRPSLFKPAQKIRAAVYEANDQIRRYAQNHADETPDLGTTVTVVVIYDNLAYILNAGDGRVYIYRDGQLTRITEDHSLAAALVREGIIEEAEVATHPKSNVILRALGVEEAVEVDTFEWPLQSGDKLLLCCDGLWKAFPNEADLGQWVASDLTAAALCQQLVSEAKQRDGSDNISVVVVKISEANNC